MMNDDLPNITMKTPGVHACFDVSGVPSFAKLPKDLSARPAIMNCFLASTYVMMRLADSVYDAGAKEWTPKVLVLSNSGTFYMADVMEMFRQPNCDHVEGIKQLCAELDAAMYCLVSEAWKIIVPMTDEQFKNLDPSNIPRPSQQPDRQEALTMKFETSMAIGFIMLDLEIHSGTKMLNIVPKKSMFRMKDDEEKAEGGTLDFGAFILNRTIQ